MAANHDPSSLGYSNLEAVAAHSTHSSPDQSDGLQLAHGNYQPGHNYGQREGGQVVWSKVDSAGRPIVSEGKIIVAYDPPEVVEGGQGREPLALPVPPTICGLRRKIFWIVLGVVAAIVVIAAAAGAGVGASLANRQKEGSPDSAEATKGDSGKSSGSSTTTGSNPPFQTLSIAAVRWVDNNSVNHYNVYYQSIISSQVRVLESAWDSEGQTWSVSPITDVGDGIVRAGTPIAASTGHPHTNKSIELVKTVFFVQPSGSMMERQSPYKEVAGVWGNDNFSRQYSPSTASSIFSYWYQNFSTRFQILSVFFQELGANSLTVARYTENGDDWFPWRDVKHSIPIQDGSPIVAAPAAVDRPDVRLYIGGTDGKLKQYPYNLETNVLGSAVNTSFEMSPRTPFCVTIEDNRNFFTQSTLPECARSGTFVTHLLLFASTDRTSLSLVSWNCSSGFVQQQSRIEGLLKPNRTYLGLATTSASNLSFSDQRVYVLFDEGTGPQVEEWEVPASGGVKVEEQNGPWKLRGAIPTKL
ncbi:hypothetical protein QBC34DRAFT_419271 [Podospora aff. communis PSN243]|uniref:Fucose-specific lectin n=1 Tax=Podospora aff. communis PSN243 TaxID=3040156 RepID=A0AAV9G0S2_9PEZI|nr:hypothetical protein QBC34DRAFT_419271 [Podospora aff. communis PSN243]